MVDPGQGLLIFDGDCGFCTSSAEWVARGWPPGPRAVPWQHLGPSGLEDLGLTVHDAETSVWWVDGAGRKYGGHLGIARTLRASKGWRRAAGRALSIPPLSWLGAVAYPVIRRYRHRLPGGTPACRMPPATDS